MKKIVLLTLLTFLVGICCSNDALAQTKKKKKGDVNDEYFDESGGFKHRLWYGGNFGLNFSGSSGYSAFSISVYPMVGYKVFDFWSVGPRVGISYTYLKGYPANRPQNIASVSLVDYSAGIFTRLKFLQTFFAHIEYEYQNYQGLPNGDLVVDSNNKVITGRVGQDNFYIGAGYNSSAGLWGYEIAILYNVLQPENSLTLPFDFRIGFTYNF